VVELEPIENNHRAIMISSLSCITMENRVFVFLVEKRTCGYTDALDTALDVKPLTAAKELSSLLSMTHKIGASWNAQKRRRNSSETRTRKHWAQPLSNKSRRSHTKHEWKFPEGHEHCFRINRQISLCMQITTFCKRHVGVKMNQLGLNRLNRKISSLSKRLKNVRKFKTDTPNRPGFSCGGVWKSSDVLTRTKVGIDRRKRMDEKAVLGGIGFHRRLIPLSPRPGKLRDGRRKIVRNNQGGNSAVVRGSRATASRRVRVARGDSSHQEAGNQRGRRSHRHRPREGRRRKRESGRRETRSRRIKDCGRCCHACLNAKRGWWNARNLSATSESSTTNYDSSESQRSRSPIRPRVRSFQNTRAFYSFRVLMLTFNERSLRAVRGHGDIEFDATSVHVPPYTQKTRVNHHYNSRAPKWGLKTYQPLGTIKMRKPNWIKATSASNRIICD